MCRRQQHQLLSLCAAAALAALCCTSQPAHAADAPAPGFLQGALPLRVAVTTPVELTRAPAASSVELVQDQALTAVFTRPVIALGSDFGSEDSAGGKQPFTLTCDVPGKYRWVTTTIFRFDPDSTWPTDLDCEMVWNTRLTTYDSECRGVAKAITRARDRASWEHFHLGARRRSTLSRRPLRSLASPAFAPLPSCIPTRRRAPGPRQLARAPPPDHAAADLEPRRHHL